MPKRKDPSAGAAAPARKRSRARSGGRDRTAESYSSGSGGEASGDAGLGDRAEAASYDPMSPREVYRRERERRAERLRAEGDPMEAARRQYREQLAAAAVAGKGGRPRKVAGSKAAPKERSDTDAPEE